MAYDALREKNGEKLAGDNPYEQTVAGYQGPAPQAMGGIGVTQSAGAQRAPQGGVGEAAASPFGGDTGASATGYVNFDRLYNANADVAQRESGKRVDAANAAGEGAKTARTGAVESFGNAVRTGTTQGPNAQDYEYATGQKSFKMPEPSGAPTSKLNADGTRTDTSEGLTSDVTRTGPAPNAAPATVDPNALSQVDYRKQIEAGVGAKYSGPDSLSEGDGYDELLKQTVAAQDLANNPLTGLGETDRALLGAAGRPRMAETASKYGKLTSELDAANTASKGTADAARKATETAANDYERLLSDYDARQAQLDAEKAARADANKAIRLTPMAGTPGAENVALGYSDDTHDPTRILSPDNHGPTAGLSTDANKLNKDNLLYDVADSWGVPHADGFDGNDKELDALIKALQITPNEWAQLKTMTDEQRRAWLADRKKKMGIA